MRALALAVALLALPLPSQGAAGSDPGLQVHVRVEGWAGTLWNGWVTLPSTYNLTVTASSGATYGLDARTPLGALWAASQEGNFSLGVSDAFEDFVVQRIAGEVHWDTRWWNYRVDWVSTDYGAQAQWLGWGAPLHPIADGSEVLWYVQTPVSLPLRMTDTGPAIGEAGACARAERVETLAVDVRHDPGQPWPAVVWGPAPLARVQPGGAPTVAGLGVALAAQPGWAWAEGPPGSSLAHFVRSDRSWLECALGA